MEMIHNEIHYEVSTLSGWHSHLYISLSIDVLKILSKQQGIEATKIEDVPHTILATYEYFIKFCLSTKVSEGVFLEYNILGLLNVVEMYQIWLNLFSEEGFYEQWIEAYLHENKEEVEPEDQKKEETGD